VPLGILAAVRRETAIDRGAVWLTIVGISTPAFASGIALLIVFSVELGWFPTIGAGSGFADRLWHLTLPALALALTGLALIVRVTRAAMITALEQDYIVFARARGLSSRHVLIRYGLRNALVPVITASGLILAAMLGGVVLVEVTFSIPGLGQLLVDSVNFKDVPMVQGAVLLVAATVIAINILTDVLYTLVDPRIRLGGS
jgi:peptide/nickel transport system permease protein